MSITIQKKTFNLKSESESNYETNKETLREIIKEVIENDEASSNLKEKQRSSSPEKSYGGLPLIKKDMVI